MRYEDRCAIVSIFVIFLVLLNFARILFQCLRRSYSVLLLLSVIKNTTAWFDYFILFFHSIITIDRNAGKIPLFIKRSTGNTYFDLILTIVLLDSIDFVFIIRNRNFFITIGPSFSTFYKPNE